MREFEVLRRIRFARHSDNEGLFGKQGKSKLIVSMSFGVSALFKLKPWPSLDSDASSFWSWMAVVRTSIFTVRIPCREESG